jgi:uncharacterized membrane protein
MLPHTVVDVTGRIDVSFVSLLGYVVATSASVWVLGAALLAIIVRASLREMLWRWGLRYLWFGLFGVFEAFWALAGIAAGSQLGLWLTMLMAVLPTMYFIAWGGWVSGALGIIGSSERASWLHRALGHPCIVWIFALCYAATFATLSILQYRALMVPHGDSAMYEEHLWNLLHGKGFRSQLDGGRLFFGEHLELIHVLLVPIYVLWPTLPLLNICISLGLGSGAIAVRGFTKRLTGSDAAANWLALAYLLYFPLQYLNMEVSLKTFRPENFGVPLLLFAIWALEAKRYRTMLSLMALTLLCKEDYAVPVAMLGLFLMVHRDRDKVAAAGTRWLGLAVFAVSALFLVMVLIVFIPAFRDGPPHYMAYFPALGDTPWAIATNVVRDPGILLRPLATSSNVLFAILLLAPLTFLPILGYGRLWLLVPTLISIMLIQLEDAHSPFFHFHAPLVPLVFWAAAEGLGRLGRLDWRNHARRVPGQADLANAVSEPRPILVAAARLAASCALVSGFFMGKSPLSLAFYDPDAGLRGYSKVLYEPNGMITWHFRNFGQGLPAITEEFVAYMRQVGRGRSFEKLFALIPQDASVAATDYIRPRFTHHRECHQYGEGGLKPHVSPESIDYIVIDLMGPYSNWRLGQNPRELAERPDRWEVMNWDPDGELFFHVLRAKRAAQNRDKLTSPLGP